MFIKLRKNRPKQDQYPFSPLNIGCNVKLYENVKHLCPLQ